MSNKTIFYICIIFIFTMGVSLGSNITLIQLTPNIYTTWQIIDSICYPIMLVSIVIYSLTKHIIKIKP
jgi:hypothetical protein